MRRSRIIGIGLVAGMTFAAIAVGSLRPQYPRPIPRMSDRFVSAIQALAKNKRFYDFLGLSDYDHASLKLLVTSNRANIGYETARAAENNERYTPPAEERLDTVNIECGDSRLQKIYECSVVRVKRRDGSEVQPLSYSARPRDYVAASGERWVVHEVWAAFSPRELSDGFVVEYTSYDGVDSTFEVSPEDARERLLLKLEEDPAIIRICAECIDSLAEIARQLATAREEGKTSGGAAN
jgi:hypothetical protein